MMLVFDVCLCLVVVRTAGHPETGSAVGSNTVIRGRTDHVVVYIWIFALQ